LRQEDHCTFFRVVCTPTSYSVNLFSNRNPISLTASTRYYFIKRRKLTVSTQRLKLTQHLEKHSLETNSDLVTLLMVLLCVSGSWRYTVFSQVFPTYITVCLLGRHIPLPVSQQPKYLDSVFHEERSFPSHLSIVSTAMCLCYVTSSTALGYFHFFRT